jgi:hypothetical protein
LAIDNSARIIRMTICCSIAPTLYMSRRM